MITMNVYNVVQLLNDNQWTMNFRCSSQNVDREFTVKMILKLTNIDFLMNMKTLQNDNFMHLTEITNFPITFLYGI